MFCIRGLSSSDQAVPFGIGHNHVKAGGMHYRSSSQPFQATELESIKGDFYSSWDTIELYKINTDFREV
jgi:hypothetical protein